ARARPATLAWPDRPSPCRTDRGAAARRGRRPDDVSAAGRRVPSRPGRVPGGGGSDPRPERAPLVVRGRGAAVGPAGSPPAPATGGRRPAPGRAGAGPGRRGDHRPRLADRDRHGRRRVVRGPFGRRPRRRTGPAGPAGAGPDTGLGTGVGTAGRPPHRTRADGGLPGRGAHLGGTAVGGRGRTGRVRQPRRRRGGCPAGGHGGGRPRRPYAARQRPHHARAGRPRAAVGRIGRTLRASGFTTHVLTASELVAAIAAVGGWDPARAATGVRGQPEQWNGWRGADAADICFRVSGRLVMPELYESLSGTRAMSATVSVRFPPAPDPSTDGAPAPVGAPGLHGLLRVAAGDGIVDATANEVERAARSRGLTLRRLDGQHGAAVYACAPTAAALR